MLSRAASRRDFLAWGSALAVTAVAWPSELLASPRRFVMKELSLDEVCLATFAAQLHTMFRVTDAPVGSVELKLIEASPTETSPLQPANAPDAQHEKFSLIFSGPKTPWLTQQIYRFEHPQIGWFAIFIVPIFTREADEQRYQAIFNRPAFLGTNSST
jgi:hypothetical protein